MIGSGLLLAQQSPARRPIRYDGPIIDVHLHTDPPASMIGVRNPVTGAPAAAPDELLRTTLRECVTYNIVKAVLNGWQRHIGTLLNESGWRVVERRTVSDPWWIDEQWVAESDWSPRGSTQLVSFRRRSIDRGPLTCVAADEHYGSSFAASAIDARR
jgi:hypothetical protein